MIAVFIPISTLLSASKGFHASVWSELCPEAAPNHYPCCCGAVVVVDWMAKWCRKCIYLKPKLQKLFQEEFPGVPLVFIDVNAVPGTLVTGNGIRVSVTSFVQPIVKPDIYMLPQGAEMLLVSGSDVSFVCVLCRKCQQ